MQIKTWRFLLSLLIIGWMALLLGFLGELIMRIADDAAQIAWRIAGAKDEREEGKDPTQVG